MKILRVSVILASIAIVFIGASAFAQKQEFPAPPPYVNPTPGEIPIIATYAFYEPEFLTREKYKELHDAGFNLAQTWIEGNKMDLALEASKGTGVNLTASVLANDEITRQRLKKYAGNDRIKLYGAGDEPKMSGFQRARERRQLFVEEAPLAMTFTNLLPSWTPEGLGAPDYKTYVEEYVKIVNPPFISFDCYPIRGANKEMKSVYYKYYETLEVISKAAKESNRPFYSFILSNKHWDYPKPTRDYLRFQIFSALAYGAQGLPYFTYTQPDFDKGKNEFTEAPLNPDGSKNDVWYMVRDVNREVKNLQKIFLNAEVLDVSHTGVKIPDSTKRLVSVPAPFRWIASDGEGIVVSHLRNGKDEYLMFVNRDVNNSQRVNMEKTRPVTRIYGNGKEKTDRSTSVTLDPGGYAIYRL